MEVLRVVEVVRESSMISSIFVYPDDPIPWSSMVPGQFIMVWIPGVDEIPMSVSYLGGEPLKLGITVQNIGEATDALCSIDVGSRIGIRGPYGNGFQVPVDGSVKLIIGVSGGVGAASTIMAMERASGSGVRTLNLVGSRSYDIMIYRKRWEEISDEVLFSTDDGSMGYHGFVTDLLEAKLGDMDEDELGATMIVTCGPEVMMSAVYDVLKRYKVRGLFSMERLMKCGLGVCDSCAVSGRRVCQDGPIFSTSEINRISEFGTTHRNRTGKNVSIRECI